MLPSWMQTTENYVPVNDSSSFLLASMKTIAKIMSRIKVQRGHEKGRTLPPFFKLCLMIAFVLLLSFTQSRLLVRVYAAFLMLYLCTWPGKDIFDILKAGAGASLLAFIMLLPAMFIKNELISNELFLVLKVFLCVVTVGIFNHTTQWNHITGALKQLHIPSVFIFTLDITLKYIVLLGNMLTELLTAVQLRSVGKNDKKYQSLGGVMGVTFIQGVETNKQMYEAMVCRGFTDDYKGLEK